MAMLPGPTERLMWQWWGSHAQDAARARIHLAGEGGQIKGFIHTYLGMSDARLPVPVHDLVTRDSVQRYPTNFAKMAPLNIQALTVRGEQLTRVLLGRYCPGLR